MRPRALLLVAGVGALAAAALVVASRRRAPQSPGARPPAASGTSGPQPLRPSPTSAPSEPVRQPMVAPLDGRPEQRPGEPAVDTGGPLETGERLALRSVRSLAQRGAATTVGEIGAHLDAAGEVEVDEVALGHLLDHLVDEGRLRREGDGYGLTAAGEAALADVIDDVGAATEPGAVELATPDTLADPTPT